jgi:hypothetical protein
MSSSAIPERRVRDCVAQQIANPLIINIDSKDGCIDSDWVKPREQVQAKLAELGKPQDKNWDDSS